MKYYEFNHYFYFSLRQFISPILAHFVLVESQELIYIYIYEMGISITYSMDIRIIHETLHQVNTPAATSAVTNHISGHITFTK